MTDVKKSRLSQNEGSKKTSRLNNSALKVRTGLMNGVNTRSDSSSLSSATASSSSNTLDDTIESKPQQVDQTNFEERAKRFLETMPEERRREWLIHQGCSYNKDRMLVQISPESKRDDASSTSLFRKRSTSFRHSQDVKDNEDNVHLDPKSFRTGQSGATEEDNERSCSTSNSSSSSAEEAGGSSDQHYEQVAELTDCSGVESPNEIIKNRYARLMARMSNEGNGLPEFGDMETVIIPSITSQDCHDYSVNNEPDDGETMTETNVDTRGLELQKTEAETELSTTFKLKVTSLNPDRVYKPPKDEYVNLTTKAHVCTTQTTLHPSSDLSRYFKNSDSDDMKLSSKLKAAYKPVVDDAIVAVLGDGQTAQTQQRNTPSTCLNINEKIILDKTDFSHECISTPEARDIMKSNIPVNRKKDLAHSSTNGKDVNLNSKTHDTNSRVGRPVAKSIDIQETVEHGSEKKELLSSQNGDENTNKTEYPSKFVDSKDAIVTLKSQDNIEAVIKSVNSVDNIATSAIDCINNINMQNANDNFVNYRKCLGYQTSNMAAHTETVSVEEARIANLRKLVDKQLVRAALKNSRSNTLPPEMTRSQNESNIHLPDLRTKKMEQGNNEDKKSFPCFVMGNKIVVEKKQNKVPVLVSTPPVQTKANKISTPSPAGNAAETYAEVKPDKAIKKKSSDSEMNVAITPAAKSSPRSKSRDMQRRRQTQQTTGLVSGVDKVKTSTQPTNKREKTVGLQSHLDDEDHRKITDGRRRADSSKKNTSECIKPNSKEDSSMTKASVATKLKRESIKTQLPSIKTATSQIKNGVEQTPKSSLKLPNIAQKAQNPAQTEQGRCDQKTNSKICAGKSFLPSVPNNAGSDSTASGKGKSVHLPSVNKTVKESQPMKIKASDPKSDNVNRNNETQEIMRAPPVKVTHKKANNSESKQAVLGKLPELDIKPQKHESTEKDAKVCASSVSVNKRVQESFKQMEDGIQREIEGRLRHAKRLKTSSPARRACKPQTLKRKENMSLDDLEDEEDDDDESDYEDESAFLSRIVTDSQIAMYGTIKDTPLIRKLDSSAIDKTKELLCDGKTNRRTIDKPLENDPPKTSGINTKISYNEIKSKALINAKQKALLTMSKSGLKDDVDDKTNKVNNTLDKSSNALVTGDLKSKRIMQFHRGSQASSMSTQCADGIKSDHDLCETRILQDTEELNGNENFENFFVDTLVLEECSYLCYDNSSCRYINTLGLCSHYMDSSTKTAWDTNTNNSRSGSDAEDSFVPGECPSEGAYSTRLDIDNIDCWSSSIGGPTNEEKTRVAKKENRRSSRIPVRAGASKGFQANKSSNRSTQNKSVSFQCDRIPQKLVVILNNKQGIKVGEAEAPIRFTRDESERNIQDTSSTIPEGQYTLEIRGESSDPFIPEAPPFGGQANDGRKLPLFERLKKYQKSKPRNIHSGTSQRSGHTSDRVLSGDIRHNRQNTSGQQNMRQFDADKTNADNKQETAQPSREVKEGDFEENNLVKKHYGSTRSKKTPASNSPYQPNIPPKKTHYRPLLRPSPWTNRENASRSKNLMSNCELFSTSSSIRTTQDHEDNIPSTGTLEKYGVGFVQDPNASKDLENITNQGNAGVEAYENISKTAGSPNDTVLLPDHDKAHSSLEYEPTPDSDEDDVLYRKEMASNQKTSPRQTGKSPVYVVSSDEDLSPELHCKTPDDESAVKTRKRSWMGIEDSPAKFKPAEEHQESDRQSNSSKQSSYREMLAQTPLNHRFSGDDVPEKPKKGFLQLIHKKVENHYDKLKDTRTPGACAREDGSEEENVSTVYNSQETELSEHYQHDQLDTVENKAANSDEDLNDEANSINSNVVNESADRTFSIVNGKRHLQLVKNADTNETDIDNTYTSDYPESKLQPDLRLSTNSTAKQIGMKRLNTALVPTPAASSPIRSIQSKRRRGNLCDKMAFTSDESSGANESVHGRGRHLKPTPLDDEDQNESRMSRDVKTLNVKFSSNREIAVGAGHELGQSGCDEGQKAQDNEERDAASSKGPTLSPSRGDCLPDGERKQLSSGQAEDKSEAASVCASSTASHDEINSELLPWPPPDFDTAEDTQAMTSPALPTEIKKKSRAQAEVLPPLSKRQSGLPHRLKVKRYY
ncbi:hypothetical protein Bpfe_025359 [Biomphalaria pfeifferi]|uniref:Uncharacterized protein n=1 Tax=Biomphalaria pfeifferi TaxID=112525 RepID=A0AAD8B256_BIOPF|nr:hypothetical protein Bpfe_025359 [Biomphalaria pfeifferi]